MLEFEFNTQIEIDTLVELFARCGWVDDEAACKLEWALAASDEWVLCKLDGELIGFGRSCMLDPLSRVVFDVMVDFRFQEYGLRAEIVRILLENAGSFEHVSIFSEQNAYPLQESALGNMMLQINPASFIADDWSRDSLNSLNLPQADANTYLGNH